MITQERKFIETAKRLHLQSQLNSLILKDTYNENPSSKAILELLVSQFAIAQSDSCLMNMSNQPYNSTNKLPTPMLFALLFKQIAQEQLTEAAKLLSLHLQRKNQEKVFILIYNLTKIYELQRQQTKRIFYLQTLLKEEPFFAQAAYDLSLAYSSQPSRLSESLNLLQRHMSFGNSHNPFIHSAFLFCLNIVSIQSFQAIKCIQNQRLTLINYFNLGLLFRKKGHLQHAFYIFSDIINRIQIFFSSSNRDIASKDLRLLILSKINLVKIRIEQNRNGQAVEIARPMLEEQIDVLDPYTRNKLQQIQKMKISSIGIKPLVGANNSLYFNTKSSFLSMGSQKNQFRSNLNSVKTEGSFMQSILGEVKTRNSNKLKHLLNKQKNIDKFFRNIVIKMGRSQKVQIGIKNSLQAAKAELMDCSRGLDHQDFQELEDQFEQSRRQQALQLNSCDIEESIKTILDNLNSMKSNSRLKLSTQGSFRASKFSIQKSIVKSQQNTSSFPKRSNFNVSKQKHKNLISERSTGSIKMKGFVDKPNIKAQQQKKDSVVIKQVQNSIFPSHDFIIRQSEGKEQQDKDSLLNSLSSSRKSAGKINKNAQKISQSTIKNNEGSTPKISDLSEIKSGHSILQKLNHSSKKQISQKTVSENKFKDNTPKVSFKDIIENTMKEESQCQQQNQLQSNFNRQNSLNCESQKSVKAVQHNIQTPYFHNKPLQKLTEVSRQSQRQTTLQRLQQSTLNKLGQSTEKQQVDGIPKQTQSISGSISLLKTSKTNKNCQDTVLKKNSQSSIKRKKSQNNSNLTQITQSNYLSKGKERQDIDRGQNRNEQQNIDGGQDKAVQEKKPFFNLLASSFKITKSPKMAKYKKINSKPMGVSSSVTTAFMNQRKKPQTSNLQKSTQNDFNRQMLKVSQLQSNSRWVEAHQKLLELYKTFKKQCQKIQLLLRIGCNFQKQERYSQAQKTFIKCTKFNSADAFLFLGSLQLKIDKIQEGVQNLEKANCIRRFDINIENKLVYGYSLREETMDKALKLAHNILKKEPNSLQTLLITAGILEKQGLIEEAIQIVKAIDQVKQTEHIKHYLGILHLASSSLKQAFNFFKQALVLKPDYVPSLIQTASIVSQSYPKQAITILTKALQLSPGNRRALARLGKIYQAESDFQNAMATYKAAIQTQQNYESYMKIGDCLSKKESYIEALLNYRQALSLKRTSQAYAKIALMFQYKNDFNKAIQNYTSAISLIANNQESTKRIYLLAIGRLQLKLGQYQTAITFLDQVLEGFESLQLFKLLGEAYFGNRQYSESLGYFQKANSLINGQDLDVLQNMAICLDRMEQYLASKAIYQKILQKNPNNIRCLNNLGNIFLIVGQTNQAFYLFQSILEKQPKNVEKRLKIADIYAQVGDWSKVEYHLLQCYRQKEHDVRILQKLVVLYKQKRDNKMAAKYQKKLNLLKGSQKNKNT